MSVQLPFLFCSIEELFFKNLIHEDDLSIGHAIQEEMEKPYGLLRVNLSDLFTTGLGWLSCPGAVSEPLLINVEYTAYVGNRSIAWDTSPIIELCRKLGRYIYFPG